MSEYLLYPFSWLLLQFFRNPTWLHHTILPHCLQPGKLSPAVAVLVTSGAHTSCRWRSPSSVPLLPPRQRAICTDTTSLPNFIELLALLGKIVGCQKKRKSGLQNYKQHLPSPHPASKYLGEELKAMITDSLEDQRKWVAAVYWEMWSGG